MLDQELKEQLKPVLAVLEGVVELVVPTSQHRDQIELLNLLEALSEINDKIKVIKTPAPGAGDQVPQTRIFRNGHPTGITFTGLPTGHEFSSLILAILNAGGKGRLPDEALQERIRRLKGPVDVKTYISLSCENCPDVVQALNQMALIHPHFRHEMIDGAYKEEEVRALGIQGVPSVVVHGKLIHSGRIGFLDLLTKLEGHFGTVESPAQSISSNLGCFDVVVVGGGPAGVSAAIYSVRKGLSTALIVDQMGGQVRETRGIENLISIPYTEGPDLSAHLAEHLGRYPVKVLENRRVNAIKAGKVHVLKLEGGETISAASLIVATGAKWRELGVPGEREYIGRGVAFCPHCDGPYYKGKKVAVIGGGNSGAEAAIDLANIVSEVLLIEFNDSLKADQILIDKMKTLNNVSVVTGARTEKILGDGQKVTHLQYTDRKTSKSETLALDGVFVQIGLIPNSSFLRNVVELTGYGEVVVDERGRTSVEGIYAAGDVTTTPYKQIIIAMGEGAKAALAAFEDRMKLHDQSRSQAFVASGGA